MSVEFKPLFNPLTFSYKKWQTELAKKKKIPRFESKKPFSVLQNKKFIGRVPRSMSEALVCSVMRMEC